MSNLPILLYFVGVLVVGLAYSSRRDHTAEDYFYGGKSTGAVAFGSSLVLSNILRYQVFLLPLAALGSFWPAIALSVIVVVLSYRLRTAANVESADFLDACGGRGGRLFVSALVFLFSITVQLGALLVLSKILLHDLLTLDFTTSALLVIVFAGIYSIVGGFAAISHTQTLQMAIVVVGMLVLAAMQAIPSPSTLVPSFAATGDFSLPGALLGLPVVSLWVWHYDRLTLRQTRAPKNVVTQRTGVVVAAIVAIVIGLATTTQSSGPAASPGGPAHQILLLVCFSVLMASFAAVFAGTAELVSKEFFVRLKSAASDQESVLVGRLVTAGVAGLTIIMMSVAETSSNRLLELFLMVQVTLFPPVTALYAARTFFRANPGAGVVPTLIAGEAVGALRIVLETTTIASGSPALLWLLSIDRLLFAFALFSFSLLVLYGAGAVAGLRLRAADRLA